MKLIALLLSALFLLTDCSEMPLNISTRKSLADYNFEEMTFKRACRELSDSGETLYYKCEITGDTARELYEIVAAQMSQPTIIRVLTGLQSQQGHSVALTYKLALTSRQCVYRHVIQL